MKNVVILISGRGSNMQSIVNAGIPNARIAAVLSNNPDAAGLAWAAERGIATAALNHKDFADRAAFDREMMRLIDRFAPDLVVLAGFMRILTPEFCAHYEGAASIFIRRCYRRLPACTRIGGRLRKAAAWQAAPFIL